MGMAWIMAMGLGMGMGHAATWNLAADGASFRHELHSTPFARHQVGLGLALSTQHAARG